jgi:hypothetical protein
MKVSPIVLFVYNRPSHTRKTVEALLQNTLAAQSDLIIFSDGPKKANAISLVEEVRKYCKSIQGFNSVRVIESPSNKGLANSIMKGVTEVLSLHETIVVLEDDMITSPHFLQYMNQALTLYKEDDQVISIHGYMYPVNQELPETFFLKGAECWGWATWRRGWALFDAHSWKLLAKIVLKGKIREFDIDNGYPYTRMLLRQSLGNLDSWAIRWYASAFLANKLTLYPGRSLVENIGLDDSGIHSKSWSRQLFETSLSNEEVKLARIEVVENKETRKILSDYFKRMQIPLIKKIFYTLRDKLKQSSGKV